MPSRSFIPLKSHVFFTGYQHAIAFSFSPLPLLIQTKAGVFSLFCAGTFALISFVVFRLYCFIWYSLVYVCLYSGISPLCLCFRFLSSHYISSNDCYHHYPSISSRYLHFFQCRTCLVFSLKHRNRKQKQRLAMKPDSSASWFSFYKRLTGFVCVWGGKSILKCIVCLREAAT